eukprot:TRINITY_DN1387_c0_g1_i2.p1 TRINITY_DN1387_c0_g1~~TRINITY_DN1387_c0_g1_i2.p1  ORF type:complete len:148 (-),score=50.74 TRINITY_DN1387_c0_g1_i2:571-1014(-)
MLLEILVRSGIKQRHFRKDRIHSSFSTQKQVKGSIVEPKMEFDLKRFQNNLKTKQFGKELIYLNQVESTMDIAMEEAKKSKSHGTIVLAEKQTKGKARKENRSWTSDPSGNLYFTIILRSPQISFFPKAHFAAPIAVVKASNQFGNI